MPTKKPVKDMSNAEVDAELDKLYKHYNVSVEPDGGATANIDLLAANEGRGKAEEAYEATQKKAAAEQKTTAPATKPKKKTSAAKPKTATKPKEEKPKHGTLSIPQEEDKKPNNIEKPSKKLSLEDYGKMSKKEIMALGNASITHTPKPKPKKATVTFTSDETRKSYEEAQKRLQAKYGKKN